MTGAAALPWLNTNSEMTARIRSHDWSATSLGAVDAWPPCLNTAAQIMLESGHAMLLAWGPERVVLYNNAYAPMLGTRHPSALGQRLEEAWPEVWEDIAPLVARAFAGETVYREDLKLVMTRKGYPEDTWWDFSYIPVRGERGEVAGLLAVVVDATPRTRAAEAECALRDSLQQLRESEARHRLLIASMAQAIWEADAEGQVVHDSPTWRAYTGQRLDQLLGSGWLDAIHPDDRAYAECKWREAVAAGEVVNAEFRLRAPGGEWRWTSVRAAPLPRADGTVEKWVGMNIDIDDRKRAESTLRESEQRLEAAIRVGRLGLWDWDVASGEVVWSDEHFRLEGYGVGEVRPSYDVWAERLHPEDREATEGAVHAAMAGDGEFAREYRVVHPDGTVRWLNGRGRFFHDKAGHPVRMIGAIMDTTERRDGEERQDLLIRELQHRTFNLLGVVRSLAEETVRSSGDIAEFRAKFGARIEALARVQRHLSRRKPAERITFDELIQGELEAVGALPPDPERLILEGPSGVELRSASVQMLALTLHELVTNAVKHGALGQDGACLRIVWRAERDEAGGLWLKLDWREHGVAMQRTQPGPPGMGQGRLLIERALPFQLGAETSFDIGSDGVRCRIALPVAGQRKN